jgi:hypothetical protein
MGGKYSICRGTREIHAGFSWENMKERDNMEDLDVGGRISEWILKGHDG